MSNLTKSNKDFEETGNKMQMRGLRQDFYHQAQNISRPEKFKEKTLCPREILQAVYQQSNCLRTDTPKICKGGITLETSGFKWIAIDKEEAIWDYLAKKGKIEQ